MTKTKIFKSKITIPILISMTVAIVIAFSMPQAEAGHSSITGDSSRTGLVGDTLTYTGFVNQFFGTESSLFSISCDSPATGTVSPTRIDAGGRPITVTVTSAFAGEFECTVLVQHCGPFRGQFPCERDGTGVNHSDELVYTSTFNNPPPSPVMCGPGTILNDENKCVPDFANICGEGTVLNDENKCIPDPDEVIMCGPGTILNDENKCVPDFANICGEGTILNDDNQCVPEPKKVDVCHKGKKTINISSNAVPAHLAHGDTLGQCS